MDLLAGAPYADGHRDQAGLYLTLGHLGADVSGSALGTPNIAIGDVSVGNRALGAYWTHFGPESWYFDAVAQLDYAEAHLRQALAGADGTSFDGAAPVETGFGGTALERALGISAQVNPATNIFAQADYGASLGGKSGGQAFKAMLGIEVGW